MTQPATYINHQLNTSIYRNSCKFSKAQRFYQRKMTPTNFNYHVSSKPTSRTTNLGVGDRSGLQNSLKNPGPNYNIPQFPRNTRTTTLGYSRQEAVFGSMINEAQKKADIPSPDTYNQTFVRGKSYSLRMKLPGENQTSAKRDIPGPGRYKVPEITPNGRYVSSRHKNTRTISFGQRHRPSTGNAEILGPTTYDVFNMDSNFSDRKVSIMKRNTARAFGTGRRGNVEDRSKVNNPGPGNYNSFSCFGGRGFVPRIS